MARLTKKQLAGRKNYQESLKKQENNKENNIENNKEKTKPSTYLFVFWPYNR
jgi:hypothetical protein